MGRRWFLVLVMLGSIGSTNLGVAEAQTIALSFRLRAELEVRDPEAPTVHLGPLPLIEERIHAEIDAQHATTTLRQVFRNQTSQRLEGQYVLRPSLDARVDGFAYYIGETRIQGEILERNTARAVYEEVTRPTVARDPALLEQTGEGEFTFRVFPIEPNEEKRVEVRTAEWLSRRGSTVTYRFPVAAPDARIEVMIRDPRARSVRSTTHAITVEPIEGGLRVRADRPTGDSLEELALRWELEDEPWQPAMFVHQDEGQSGYFIMSLAASDGFDDRVSAKDVTLVLDHSGSMSGEPILRARDAAADVIRRLGAHDRVNVIAFDDDVDPLFHRPRVADESTKQDALQFVAGLNPGGGTDIAFALRAALEFQHADEERPRVVIFITDGRSDVGPALAVASQSSVDARVFTVGIGDGVNHALLSRIAALQRGTFTFIDRASRIEAELGHLYAQIAHPLLVDVSIELEGATAFQTYPRTIPDLFVDGELLIAGRFRGARGPIRVRVNGRLGEAEVSYHNTAAIEASARRPWIGRRWAIGRVDHLLEDIALGQSDDERRQEVVSLALAYHFATPLTSFLAIPESEVTANARQMLDTGRAQRMAAEVQHADANALDVTSGSYQFAIARPVSPMEQRLQASPPVEIASAPDEWAGDEESDSESYAEPASLRANGAGCASCSVGARSTPRWLWIVFVGFLLTVLVRRRVSFAPR